MAVANKYIIVIPASLKDTANTWVKAGADSEGGEETFSVGLSTTGSDPATHYWCNWRLDDSHKVDTLAYINGDAEINVYDTTSYTPQQVLDELSLKTIDSVI